MVRAMPSSFHDEGAAAIEVAVADLAGAVGVGAGEEGRCYVGMCFVWP